MRRCNAKLSRYIGDSGKQYTIPPLVLELRTTLDASHSFVCRQIITLKVIEIRFVHVKGVCLKGKVKVVGPSHTRRSCKIRTRHKRGTRRNFALISVFSILVIVLQRFK